MLKILWLFLWAQCSYRNVGLSFLNSSNFGIFGNNLIPLSNTKLGVGQGVQICTLIPNFTIVALECGLKSTKIMKIWNFRINLPLRENSGVHRKT